MSAFLSGREQKGENAIKLAMGSGCTVGVMKKMSTVDLRGEGGGDGSLLASGGLKEDRRAVGLVKGDLVDSAVGLELDLLGVDHLNGGDDTTQGTSIFHLHLS